MTPVLLMFGVPFAMVLAFIFFCGWKIEELEEKAKEWQREL
jgi:hypothetical protein